MKDHEEALRGEVGKEWRILDARDAERFLKWYASRNCLPELGLSSTKPMTLSDWRAAIDRLPPPDLESLVFCL